jgi:hypothetical protein
MNNEPVALTQGDILSILQDANSVLVGQPIWNSTEEYNKLKAIIESAIRYTHPVKELNDGGEPVKNATYWKRQYNLMATQNDNLKSGLYHANEQIKYLESHPVKELTDEEIWEVIDNCFGVHAFNLDYQIALDEAREDAFELVKAILRKAQDK